MNRAHPLARSRVVLLRAAAVVALIAVACGDDDATPATSPDENAATVAAAATLAPTATATPIATPTATVTPTPTPTATATPAATVTPTATASPVAPTTSPLAAAPEQRTTDIVNFAFERTITVPAGSTVTWTNRDDVPHTATDDNGTLFDSDFLLEGDGFSHTFEQAGTFTYFCRVHPFMKGTVIVQ
jgi:plastocyanin